MVRLVLLLLTVLVLFPVLVSAEEVNNTTSGPGDYSIGHFAVLSFSDETVPGEFSNSSGMKMPDPVSQNQTRRGGEMSARKLFELKQAARDEIRGMNGSMDLSTGLSLSSAKKVSIICKQCVPQSKWEAYGY